MPPSEQPRVFISYARKDGAALAKKLHQDLATWFDIWFDTQRLTAGDIWSREIEDVIPVRVQTNRHSEEPHTGRISRDDGSRSRL
jgi:hypothetical protein